jgi:uncharacterized protein YndB with AHSA1/START domain
VIEYTRSRSIDAPPEEIWAVVADPARLPEWFEGIDRVRTLDGDPELGRHAIEGPWGEQRFEIVRVLEQEKQGSRLSWRDESELLDGEAPADPWHIGSWFEIALEQRPEGVEVTLTGRQAPASAEWRERLLAVAPRTEAQLDSSLERLAELLEGS